jgi:hypothetical protein
VKGRLHGWRCSPGVDGNAMWAVMCLTRHALQRGPAVRPFLENSSVPPDTADYIGTDEQSVHIL